MLGMFLGVARDLHEVRRDENVLEETYTEPETLCSRFCDAASEDLPYKGPEDDQRELCAYLRPREWTVNDTT